MFDELSAKLTAALSKLTGRGVLTEEAVKDGLREIRRVLLEADVSFDLTREFLERVEQKAVGAAAAQGGAARAISWSRSSTTSWSALLGEKQAPIAFASVPPTVILLVGLQGSGKTTTAGKLAKRLKLEQKAPFLVAADVYRPAAVDQLVDAGAGRSRSACHSEPGVTDVVGIVRRGIVEAGKARARTVLVDTAGRLQIDAEMMDELKAAQGGGQAARDPARRRRHDRPGRGADRERLPRGARGSPA